MSRREDKGERNLRERDEDAIPFLFSFPHADSRGYRSALTRLVSWEKAFIYLTINKTWDWRAI